MEKLATKIFAKSTRKPITVITAITPQSPLHAMPSYCIPIEAGVQCFYWLAIEEKGYTEWATKRMFGRERSA